MEIERNKSHALLHAELDEEKEQLDSSIECERFGDHLSVLKTS